MLYQKGKNKGTRWKKNYATSPSLTHLGGWKNFTTSHPINCAQKTGMGGGGGVWLVPVHLETDEQFVCELQRCSMVISGWLVGGGG